MSLSASSLVRLGLLAGLALAACAPVDETDADDSTADEVRAAAPMFVRVRPDLRRCVSPICGGAWVSRVNQRTLRCADGSSAAECYVAEVDYSGLGLSDAALEAFRGHAFILRGRIVSKSYGSFGSLGQFVAQEGWRAATDAATTATVYATFNTPRVCVRAPCPTYDADKLNGTTSYTLVGVDLSGVAGASRADRNAAALGLAASPGILVAGAVRTSGESRTLAASQFYLRVSPGVSDATFCQADADCRISTLDRDVASSADCYCTFCPATPLNVTTAGRFDRDYQHYCTTFHRSCPQVRCIVPPPAACVNHACVAGPRP